LRFRSSEFRLSGLAALALALAAPVSAEFLELEMRFQDAGCEPCIESLEGRLERVRGVETATVDAEKGEIRLVLSETNRVRLGPLRGRVTQDGTKILETQAVARGALERIEGALVFVHTGFDERLPASWEGGGSAPRGPGEAKGRIAETDGGFVFAIDSWNPL
jgi:hypothetical protein